MLDKFTDGIYRNSYFRQHFICYFGNWFNVTELPQNDIKTHLKLSWPVRLHKTLICIPYRRQRLSCDGEDVSKKTGMRKRDVLFFTLNKLDSFLSTESPCSTVHTSSLSEHSFPFLYRFVSYNIERQTYVTKAGCATKITCNTVGQSPCSQGKAMLKINFVI